jgi:hypothetical protein
LAPYSAPPGPLRTSDARHIGQRHIDIFPKHAAGQRGIDAASINLHQQLVGGCRRVEAARADGVGKAVDARHFQVGRQPKRLGQVDGAGAANVLVGNHVGGRGRLGQKLGPARDAGDLDFGKLFDGKGAQIGVGGHLLGMNGQHRTGQQDTSQNTQWNA